MVKHGQTVFYLERLQNTWLPQRQGWAVRASSRLASGLVGGLGVGLIGGLIYALVDGLPYGESVWRGLGLGLIGGLSLLPSTQDISLMETLHWSWSQFWLSLPSRLVRVLVVVLVVGLVVGLIVGLIYGLSVGLSDGLSKGLRVFMYVGPAFGLVVILGVGPAFGLVFALAGGLVGGELETRTVPNQGVRRSVRNGLRVGLGFGLVFVLVFWLIFGLIFGRSNGLMYGVLEGLGWGLTVGLMVGLGGWLHAGGGVFLKHAVLRLWLIRDGSTPWNYVRFLDYAAERILLRKVGGGYVFLHRMLMEYFAAQYVEPSVEGQRSSMLSRLEVES